MSTKMTVLYGVGPQHVPKAKLPQPLWNDVLCFGKRLACADLLQHGVVNAAPPASELRARAVAMAQESGSAWGIGSGSL